MSDRADCLYDLLPAEFRRQDETRGFVLKALMRVMGEVYGDLERDVAGLYDNWFVETAPLDQVYAIGNLVGIPTPAYPLPEHRAMVADAIGLRRRKGVATALAPLLKGASGWSATPATDVDGRPAAWPLDFVGLDDPYGFDNRTGPAEDGMPSLELWTWRLPVLQAAGPAAPLPPPSSLPSSLQAWFTNSLYAFNSLGLTQRIWNLPGPPLSPVSTGPADALPAALTAAMLAAGVEGYCADFLIPGMTLTVPPLPADSLFYGPDAGLAIRLVGSAGPGKPVPVTLVPASELQPADLSGAAFPAPDFPVFVTGTIAVAGVEPGTAKIDLALGGSTFEVDLTLAGALPFTLPRIAAALQAAIRQATAPTPGAVPSSSPLSDLTVQVFGPRLAIIPGDEAFQSVVFTPADGDPGGLIHQLGLTAADGAEYLAAIRSAPLSADDLAVLETASGTLKVGGGRAAGFSLSLPPPPAFRPLNPVSLLAFVASAAPGAAARFVGDRLLVLASPPSAAAGTPVDPGGLPALQRRLGLQPGVAVDPAHGLLALPQSLSGARQVLVEYGYAFPGPIGGGSYPRTPAAPAADAWVFPVSAASPLSGALAAWRTQKPRDAVLEFAADAVQTLPASITLAAACSLDLRAPDGVRGDLRIDAEGGASLSGAAAASGGSALAFDGLTINGGLVAAGGALRLAFTDCTLYPAPALPPSTTPTSLSAAAPGTPIDLTLERCLAGALALADGVGPVSITDTIVGGLAASDAGNVVLAGPSAVEGSSVLIQRGTILGEVAVGAPLTATDTLFVGALRATGGVDLRCCVVGLALIGPRAMDLDAAEVASSPLDAGVVRCAACAKLKAAFLKTAYVAALSLPARFEASCACAAATPDVVEPPAADGPEAQLSAAVAGLGPVRFYPDDAYPSADFARPSLSNASEILMGSSVGGEIGAYGLSGATQRRAMFFKTLEDNLPMGVGYRVHYRS